MTSVLLLQRFRMLGWVPGFSCGILFTRALASAEPDIRSPCWGVASPADPIDRVLLTPSVPSKFFGNLFLAHHFIR